MTMPRPMGARWIARRRTLCVPLDSVTMPARIIAPGFQFAAPIITANVNTISAVPSMRLTSMTCESAARRMRKRMTPVRTYCLLA